MVEVVSIKVAGKPDPTKPWEVYIGRACYGLSGSALGNHWTIGRDGDRNEVIRKYEIDLKCALLPEDLRYMCNGKETLRGMRLEFERLVALYRQHGKLGLFCWCAPLPCHGDVIRDMILAAK